MEYPLNNIKRKPPLTEARRRAQAKLASRVKDLTDAGYSRRLAYLVTTQLGPMIAKELKEFGDKHNHLLSEAVKSARAEIFAWCRKRIELLDNKDVGHSAQSFGQTLALTDLLEKFDKAAVEGANDE